MYLFHFILGISSSSFQRGIFFKILHPLLVSCKSETSNIATLCTEFVLFIVPLILIYFYNFEGKHIFWIKKHFIEETVCICALY